MKEKNLVKTSVNTGACPAFSVPSLHSQSRLLFVLFTLLCIVLFAHNAQAACSGYPHSLNLQPDESPVPDEYGTVIFRCNEDSPKHLYVIGIGHRDTLTRANGDWTVEAQVEVYRITEGLIKRYGLNLVLPEGYFSRTRDDRRGSLPYVSSASRGISFDTGVLKNRLASDRLFVNAEMLLMESYGINVLQIEDIDLYNAVKARIGLLEKVGDGSLTGLFVKSELVYLQERRTAGMLQKIPLIIEDEFREGRISSRRAVFTIGMVHLAEIMRYLQTNSIEITSPAFTAFEDYAVKMSLLNQDFGVTVIVPRSLTGEMERMMLTKLGAVH